MFQMQAEESDVMLEKITFKTKDDKDTQVQVYIRLGAYEDFPDEGMDPQGWGAPLFNGFPNAVPNGFREANLDEVFTGFENYGPAGEMFLEKILPAMPAKRFATPEEISSAVVWLLSEGASYVTGSVVSVDGGSAFHFLPLIDIEDTSHLPIYGTLPRKAKL